MAHGKNKKQNNQKKETREERRARLEAEDNAREFCFQILPYIGAGIFIVLVSFALWVHTVLPKEYNIMDQVNLDPTMMSSNGDVNMMTGGGGINMNLNMVGNAPEAEIDETTIEL
uniref:Uncharacterized protein n=1 Tax=Eucampia antarctica TaxID=49252 RepID=A0A7S2R5A6_9STRA|mmetsp:Transcript_1705/g.1616  ORF Transcript_1705/g.1616 Transcript_1705/m.1616 type:complete len:115 (+) Transcript_1705:60-404(+)|eukprot:CAMPEP_0197836654 /NCGR_PEP_ID=MMETSP1437-20131217/29636_1 /TAXON_ID=49252 ORGANISM="Eucampia antarctica, Strain CCMP1452" /NCGR_SAMPLE_ID=MMETSP1437 /ASSEMBLY_ACC=CAM_ASM_001096 /LENGTH=114 /DNA_ID=CAMNT_0043443001 /DNA_START=60 /DNA_END=404 /DNA_ORIENTATION=+